MRKTRLELIGLISVLWFIVKAQDSFIVVKEKPVSSSLPQNIYLIPLNDSGGTQAIQMSDIPNDAITGGILLDGFRRSILWTKEGVIKSINIDDNTTAIIADLSSGDFSLRIVTDLALDTETGNVYFVGYRSSSFGSPPKKGFVGAIDTNGTATELYYTATESFADLALDFVNRLMFPVLRLSTGTTYTIKRMNLNGKEMGDVKRSFSLFVCLAVDIVDQYVVWSDGGKIYRLGYDGSNETEFYDPPGKGGVRDMKVVDDYVYFVGLNYEELWKVHKLDASNVTAILSSGLFNMAYLDVPTVFGPLVTSCSIDALANVHLPENCDQVGESCKNFTCDYGYKKNENIESLNCSASGMWNVDLSSLCIEIICPGNVLHGALSGSCQSKAGESCSGYTCNTGFRKNESVTDLSCLESGEWSENLSSLCIEWPTTMSTPTTTALQTTVSSKVPSSERESDKTVGIVAGCLSAVIVVLIAIIIYLINRQQKCLQFKGNPVYGIPDRSRQIPQDRDYDELQQTTRAYEVPSQRDLGTYVNREVYLNSDIF